METKQQPLLITALRATGLDAEYVRLVKAGKFNDEMVKWCRSHPLLRHAFISSDQKPVRAALGIVQPPGGKRPAGAKTYLTVRNATVRYRGGRAAV